MNCGAVVLHYIDRSIEKEPRPPMADPTKVRIAMQSVRELELEVDDGETVASELEAAVGNGEGMVWVVDSKGSRHGIAVDKLAFVVVDSPEERPGVGFSAKE